ncbi:MAG: tryptophan 2,3-dioxygenase family protein [Pseudomonadota bacterium]
MTTRELEPGIITDLDRRNSYANYLHLDRVLNAQVPLSDPPHHDEMLFIIQHQVAELWFKLLIHELRAARQAFVEDKLHRAQKTLTRVRHVQREMYSQWSILATLTPSEYAEFRKVFGHASGFQSPQYRLMEYLLGARDRAVLKLHRDNQAWYPQLRRTASEPSVFDEFLRTLARRGFDIPAACTERDFAEARELDPGVVAALKTIYENPDRYWAEYEICESLMDVGNNFQFWRFHHMKTVERIIGHKRGTGGSSGVSFLKRAMDDDFFPELIQVRTEIGA